jgi:hypothetical protein
MKRAGSRKVVHPSNVAIDTAQETLLRPAGRSLSIQDCSRTDQNVVGSMARELCAVSQTR